MRFEARIVHWNVFRADEVGLPRTSVIRTKDGLDSIVLCLLLPSGIVGERLARRASLGLERLDALLVPEKDQFVFVLRQGNRPTDGLRVDLEHGNDVERLVEVLVRARRSRVEGDQMMEQIRRRENVDVEGDNVLDGGMSVAETSDVAQKVGWVRSGIALVRVVDVG